MKTLSFENLVNSQSAGHISWAKVSTLTKQGRKMQLSTTLSSSPVYPDYPPRKIICLENVPPLSFCNLRRFSRFQKTSGISAFPVINLTEKADIPETAYRNCALRTIFTQMQCHSAQSCLSTKGRQNDVDCSGSENSHSPENSRSGPSSRSPPV